MSNIVNDIIMDNLRDKVHELWVIEGRPDLEDDCLDYCYENIHTPVAVAMIEFLSQHCTQALSTDDLKQMANESLNAQRNHYTREES